MSHLLSDRRFKVLAGAVVAAGAANQFSGTVQAAPIFNLKVLVRNVTDAEGSFTASNISANTGDVLEYQIVGNMAPVGTVYTGAAGFTITSLSANIDGMQSLRVDLFELASDPEQATLGLGALGGDWNDAPDNSVGSLVPRGNGNNDVSSIRPIRTAGNFGAISEDVMYTGTMTVTAESTTAGLVRLRWATGSGAFHVNGTGLAKFISLATETGTAPFLSYTPAAIAVVPEPTSLSLLGLAGLGLLARRKK